MVGRETDTGRSKLSKPQNRLVAEPGTEQNLLSPNLVPVPLDHLMKLKRDPPPRDKTSNYCIPWQILLSHLNIPSFLREGCLYNGLAR